MIDKLQRPPTKAVILARGLGTRMRAEAEGTALDEAQQRAANCGVKAMIPVGRPFLDHVMSELADAGFTDVCLVIGPEHRMITDYYGALATDRVRISFAPQAEPLGTADAVLAARDFTAADHFCVVNSDNFYPSAALRLLQQATASATIGYESVALVRDSNIPADRVATFAVLCTDETGRLSEIIEKPTAAQLAVVPPPVLVSMNCWLFTPHIFTAIDSIEPSPRGEHELPDAVRAMIAAGHPLDVFPTAAGVLDLSSRSDISSVAAALADHRVFL